MYGQSAYMYITKKKLEFEVNFEKRTSDIKYYNITTVMLQSTCTYAVYCLITLV